MQIVCFSQLFSRLWRWQITFICKNKDASVFQIVVDQEVKKLYFACEELWVISRINNVYYCLRVMVISVPVRSQIFLSAEVPYLHFQIRVLHLLNVWPDCWLGHYHFSQTQFVQNSSFATVRHSYDADLHKLIILSSQPFPKFRQIKSH